MRPPFWKKWLSYLVDLHIEDAPSDYNPHLHLCLFKGRYQLCTENAIYSYGDLYDNFVGTFVQLDLKSRSIDKVLVLGFGLASIPIILEKTGYQYQYTGVEIDEEVIYLASKYELPHLKSPVEVICADAASWVAMTEEQFDLIAVDVFLDDVIPDRFKQTTFLEQTKNLLTENGLLIYNCLASTEGDEANAKQFFQDRFLPVFPKGRALKVHENLMLISA